MATPKFTTPTLVVKNISSKSLRLLKLVPIKPGQTVDLFPSVDAKTQLFPDQIMKALEKPHGELYRECVLNKNIEILNLDLPAFVQSIVKPDNIDSVNPPAVGKTPIVDVGNKFQWITPVSSAALPISLSALGNVSISKASLTQDGYLSKEDFGAFISAKGIQRIWQYQDFIAPVGTNLTITSFENGTGFGFNSGFIVGNTAVATLISDSNKFPTSTVTFPANLLPSNRVKVVSHTGNTVVLNKAPDLSLGVRLFFLITVPANVSLPSSYQEDPEFINDSFIDELDDTYINQNDDESIFGIKTFENGAIFNQDIVIATNPNDQYLLTSNIDGYGSWKHYPVQSPVDLVLPVPVGGDLYFNTSLNELMQFDGLRNKWLSVSKISVQSGRNGLTGASSFYRGVNGMVLDALNRGFPVPKGTLTSLSLSRIDFAPATLECLVNGVVIATLVSTVAGETIDTAINADFLQGKMSFRNQAAGNTTSNVQILAIFSRRS